MLLPALMAMAIAAPSDEGAPGLGAPGAAQPPVPGVLEAALPPGTLEAFKAVCIANNAQTAGAVQTAEKLNWSVPPKELLTALSPQTSLIQDVQARMLGTGSGAYVLLVGKNSPIVTPGSAGRPVPNATCMVIGFNIGPDATLQGDLTKWIGGEPTDTSPDTVIYAYTESNGVRTSLSGDQAEKAYGDGKLNMVMLRFKGETRMLIHIVPTQVN